MFLLIYINTYDFNCLFILKQIWVKTWLPMKYALIRKPHWWDVHYDIQDTLHIAGQSKVQAFQNWNPFFVQKMGSKGKEKGKGNNEVI